MPHTKILDLDTLARTLSWMKRPKRIVFTNGCFDILHYGHVMLLERAKRLGDVLVVGLNSDRSVKRIKGGGRPVNSQRDRARILAALSAVDFVVIFHETTPERVIRTLIPNILVKGADWKHGSIVGEGFVKSRGGSVVRVKLAKGYSTTALIRRIGRCAKV